MEYMDWIIKIYYIDVLYITELKPEIDLIEYKKIGIYSDITKEVFDMMKNGSVIENLPDGRLTVVKPIKIEIIPDYSKEKK